MVNVRLPFWLVTEQRHILNPPETIPCNDPRSPHAFTTMGALSAYLQARRGGSWNVHLIGEYNGLLAAIADLHHDGVPSICFDPKPDGSGGEVVNITDVFATLADFSAEAG